MIHLEAITTCFKYGDFLAETAPVMRHLFDKWVIVTSPDDAETREVARRYNLHTLLTEDHTRDGPFGKGRVIERGLQQLSANAWHLHVDSDTVLPADLHLRLESARLDTQCIYSWDRVMLTGWDAWQKVKQSGYLNAQLDYHCRVHWPEGVPYQVGTRWAHPQEGWCPIGMSQLTHASAIEWRGVRVRPYPIHHGDACRTDIQFSLQFDRHRRVFLPEIIAVHLESEQAGKGANWNGRTTKRFGPPQIVNKSAHCS